MEQPNSSGHQLQLQDLPQEILERIFALLTFRERIRAERVSRAWRALCQHWAWTRQRWIVCTREMLQIPEPWKNAEAIEQEMRKVEQFQAETSKRIRAYYKLHQDCDGIHEDKKGFCPGCPRPTNVGKNVDKYCEMMWAKQQRAMVEYRHALSNPSLYKQRRPSRQLLILRALLRRCGAHLLGLHLGPGIGVDMRHGRFFPTMTSLAHLRVDEPLDEWHFRQIETHLADQLLSLSIGTLWSRRKSNQTALASLLARCRRLESLCMENLCDLFFSSVLPVEKNEEEVEEEKEEVGNGKQKSLQNQLEPIVPRTVRNLHIRHECDRVYSVECANQLRALLVKCPQLRYFLPILWDSRWRDVDLEDELVKRLMSLQWPYVYSRKCWYLELHPRLATLRALRLEPEDGVKASDLLLIADHCVQLEHLDVKLVYRVRTYHRYDSDAVVPLREELGAALLQGRLPRLCSLGFTIIMYDRDIPNEQMHFHELYGDDDQQLDKTFLDILTKRNAIKPLRSLELHHDNHYNCAHLSKENILDILQNMPHLETLSCPIREEWPCVEIGEFATIVKATLDDTMNLAEALPSVREKTLRFQHSDASRKFYSCGISSVFKWRAGAVADEQQKPMEMTRVQPAEAQWSHDRYRPERSVVLRDILEQTFGQDARQTLFGEII